MKAIDRLEELYELRHDLTDYIREFIESVYDFYLEAGKITTEQAKFVNKYYRELLNKYGR